MDDPLDRSAGLVTLAEVGLAGQDIDVLHGGDVDPTGRLLSVTEIQQAFRELRARRAPEPVLAGVGTAPSALDTDGHSGTAAGGGLAASNPARTGGDSGPGGVSCTESGGDTARAARSGRGDTASTARSERGDTARAAASIRRDEPIVGGSKLDVAGVTVVAAHAGAGASTVALAVSAAASQAGRHTHLLDSAHPCRSGLAAAADVELGTDRSGAWRRGSRELITIDRRAHDATSGCWPAPPPGHDDSTLTVVDLGLVAVGSLERLARDVSRIVVVCRPTVPGVRMVEHLLAQLAGQVVLVAAVGPARWAGEVTATVGPRLRQLRTDGLVVTVPVDRHLEITGLSHAPLPRSVLVAGRVLLELLDNTPSNGAPATPGCSTSSAPRSAMTSVHPAPDLKGTT